MEDSDNEGFMPPVDEVDSDYVVPDKKYGSLNSIVEAQEELLDRKLTIDERDRLHKVKDSLGIKNNDTLWVLLLQLERYNSEYDAVPEKISMVVEDCISRLRDATAQEIERVELDIERQSFKAAGIHQEIENQLLNSANVSAENVYNKFQETLDKQQAVLERKASRSFMYVASLVSVVQMMIIIITNGFTAFIVTGNPNIPWVELSEKSTQIDWLFQFFWNFPAGWVMMFIVMFNICGFGYYKYLKRDSEQ